MSTQIKKIKLSYRERKGLEDIARRPSTAQALALRCRIILMSADGQATGRIVKSLDTSRATVSKWKHRFTKYGISGLNDSHRPGKPLKYSDTTRLRISAIADRTRKSGLHWSIRQLADYLNLNRGIVERVLKTGTSKNKN